MLSELCKLYNIIAIQEHWLRADELDKLSLINCDFNSFAASGMVHAAASGLLRGRPFGGVGFLFHKSLKGCIQLIGNDCSSRCMAIKCTFNNKVLIIFN